MSIRNNNQLPNNLPQLQNCIKRDAESYRDEFRMQNDRFQAVLDVIRLDPSAANKDMEELVMFLAHVCPYYMDDLESFPADLTGLLKQYGNVMHPAIRLSICKALILIRNRGLLTANDLLKLLFELLRCQDKGLRVFLKNTIITDIKNMNSKHRDPKVNSQLQSFMYSMLDDNNQLAAKISLEIMVELYSKHVWMDAKTVNVIAAACFSKSVKMMVTALTFFLGRDDDNDKNSDDEDSEDEKDKTSSANQVSSKTVKQTCMANRVNKKTNKRMKQLKRLEKAAKKKVNKKEPKEHINFSALHLIYDPQSMAEKLLKLLQTTNERFEVKMMIMNLISRLVGVHDLFLFNFYPLLQRYLQPRQKEVTKILLYTAQACHEVVPADVLEPVLRTVVDNFVSDRNSTECITVGLNTVREICSRCPLVMNEDLLQDLVLYQKYKDKNVSMAARSLIQLFRVINPSLLQRKDRGKPTEATIEQKVKDYRELDAKNFVPGAEVLVGTVRSQTNESEDEDEDEGWETDGEDEEQEWETDNDDDDEEEEEEEEDNDMEGEWQEVSDDEEQEEKKGLSKPVKETRNESNEARLKKMHEEAALVSSSRILTDEEFRLMRKNQVRKQFEAIHPRIKRRHEESDSSDELDSDAEDVTRTQEIVSLKSIERLYKKPRANKESRLSTVLEGRDDKEKLIRRREKMNPFSSTKQKEKNKNKAFSMIKYKVKGKKKKSFHEKQARLKKSLLKQARQLR